MQALRLDYPPIANLSIEEPLGQSVTHFPVLPSSILRFAALGTLNSKRATKLACDMASIKGGSSTDSPNSNCFLWPRELHCLGWSKGERQEAACEVASTSDAVAHRIKDTLKAPANTEAVQSDLGGTQRRDAQEAERASSQAAAKWQSAADRIRQLAALKREQDDTQAALSQQQAGDNPQARPSAINRPGTPGMEKSDRNAVILSEAAEAKVFAQISKARLRGTDGGVIRAGSLWEEKPALLLLLRRPGCSECPLT